jgi:hypothetical protein
MGFRGKLEIQRWAGIILDNPREYSSTKQGLSGMKVVLDSSVPGCEHERTR